MSNHFATAWFDYVRLMIVVSCSCVCFYPSSTSDPPITGSYSLYMPPPSRTETPALSPSRARRWCSSRDKRCASPSRARKTAVCSRPSGRRTTCPPPRWCSICRRTSTTTGVSTPSTDASPSSRRSPSMVLLAFLYHV